MSTYHPENDPSNPDQPRKSDTSDGSEDAAYKDGDHAATASPDPLEGNITGLEPGGGVPPGETPPAEDSMSADQGHDE